MQLLCIDQSPSHAGHDHHDDQIPGRGLHGSVHQCFMADRLIADILHEYFC